MSKTDNLKIGIDRYGKRKFVKQKRKNNAGNGWEQLELCLLDNTQPGARNTPLAEGMSR